MHYLAGENLEWEVCHCYYTSNILARIWQETLFHYEALGVSIVFSYQKMGGFLGMG